VKIGRGVVVAALVLVVVPLTSVPAAAATSDVSVGVSAFEDVNGPGLGAPIEGTPSLVIGTRVRLAFHVEQTGESFPYVFRLLLEGEPSYWTNPGRVTWALLPNDTCRFQADPTDAEASQVVECPGGGTLDLVAQVLANAPGTLAVVGSVDTTGFGDTDPTDDAATWLAESVCSVQGTDGEDVLEATDSSESICGGPGDDRFVGLGEFDKAFGEEGNDSFSGGEGGGSVAVGGLGVDVASFAHANRPITICILEPGVATNVNVWTPQAMIQIERFVGSPYGDVISGTASSDVLFGLAGSDVLLGRAGEDRLRGGRGDDRFVTRDVSIDQIMGGRGTDLARADASDVVRSARRTRQLIEDPCA
jgi:Ca2+-binding RTX toxin-like protein